jgi:hypothetical protein
LDFSDFNRKYFWVNRIVNPYLQISAGMERLLTDTGWLHVCVFNPIEFLLLLFLQAINGRKSIKRVKFVVRGRLFIRCKKDGLRMLQIIVSDKKLYIYLELSVAAINSFYHDAVFASVLVQNWIS